MKNEIDENAYFIRREGPTPNGGVYSIAYYSKADGTPCPRKESENVEIVEFDKDGNRIMSTYGFRGNAVVSDE